MCSRISVFQPYNDVITEIGPINSLVFPPGFIKVDLSACQISTSIDHTLMNIVLESIVASMKFIEGHDI